MAKISPESLFPGYSSDGTSITFPLSDLPDLSSAEANAETGNVGEVFRVLMLETSKRLAALAPEAQDSHWTVTKNNPSIAPGGSGYLRQTFSPRFDAEIIEVNLAENGGV